MARYFILEPAFDLHGNIHEETKMLLFFFLLILIFKQHYSWQCTHLVVSDLEETHTRLQMYNWSLTNDTFGKRGPLQCRQAQVSNFDRTRRTSDEDVVTLQVSVNDGRGPGVEEVEAFENLPAPAPENFGLHDLKPLQIPAGRKKKSFWNVLNPAEVSLKSHCDHLCSFFKAVDFRMMPFLG